MTIRVFWWEEWLRAEGPLQLVYSDVHGCSNQIIYATWRCRFQLGWSLIFLFRSLIVWWWKVNCLCKYYNVTMHMSPLKLLFFTSFLTQNNFFYFSFDATYYIAFHTLVAPNIMFNFHWCCMLQSFLCILRLMYHFYVFYCFSGCHHAKISNFVAEKLDVPQIAPK